MFACRTSFPRVGCCHVLSCTVCFSILAVHVASLAFLSLLPWRRLLSCLTFPRVAWLSCLSFACVACCPVRTPRVARCCHCHVCPSPAFHADLPVSSHSFVLYCPCTQADPVASSSYLVKFYMDKLSGVIDAADSVLLVRDRKTRRFLRVMIRPGSGRENLQNFAV